MREAHEPVGERMARSSPLELLRRDRLPEGVDDLGRIAVDPVDGKLQMLRPEAKARLAGELRIVRDDVQLGVVDWFSR